MSRYSADNEAGTHITDHSIAYVMDYPLDLSIRSSQPMQGRLCQRFYCAGSFSIVMSTFALY